MDKNTNNINKDIKKHLLISIIISVMFVVGIPILIVGATNSNYAIMGIGIAMVVIGFYGAPMMWVSYGNKRSLKNVVDAVMEDHLTTVGEIASQLQMRERPVRDLITNALRKKYITGYIFNGSTLTPNQKEAPKKKISSNRCPNCGGTLTEQTNGYTCEYCGSHFKKE